jgi:hypothetical protein
MTNQLIRGACALALAIALPSAAFAQQRGGPQRSAAPPQARAAAPAARPAPVRPAAPAAPAGGGFNFNRDLAPAQRRPVVEAPPAPSAPQRPVAQRPPAPQQRPVAQGPAVQPRQGGRSGPPAGYHAAPVSNRTGGPLAGRFTGPIVRNSRENGGAYGWNHGVRWQPAPIYWGGGFWGPYAVADLAALTLFGWIADDQNQVVYNSYQLEPDSPGWQLLQDYQLQQTPCGPPDLVVIWGPDDSVICAYPNDIVGEGNYDVDPATFSLVSAAP